MKLILFLWRIHQIQHFINMIVRRGHKYMRKHYPIAVMVKILIFFKTTMGAVITLPLKTNTNSSQFDPWTTRAAQWLTRTRSKTLKGKTTHPTTHLKNTVREVNTWMFWILLRGNLTCPQIGVLCPKQSKNIP